MSTYMKIIEPITITDEMVGSGAGTVPEYDYAEWAGASVINLSQRVMVKRLTGLGTAARNWYGLCVAINGDVYATVNGVSIWKQTVGAGQFADLVPGNKDWTGICAAPNGDIYAAVYGASIWISTNSGTTFADLGAVAGNKNWTGMCAAPNGDIYAAVYGASIWVRSAGSGNFTDLGADAGNKNWSAICAAPNGDIYAAVYGGSIWKRAGGTGAFADLATGNKNWRGLAASPAGDIYATVYGASLYKCLKGATSFGIILTSTLNWMGMAISAGSINTGIYYCVASGDIWAGSAETNHKVYESLINSNSYNYPPIDVNFTTPKWLEVSSTNKWKCLDSKTTSQTETPSPAIYTITPGVAHDSIALLGLSATSVRVQGTSAAYDTTVATGATDIVLTNLGGLAANVLTITITNTAGLAKVGEIVIGNSYTLGTFRPGPTVGITDYSTKTIDDFGDYTIIPRSFSKKMTAAVQIPVASVDAVFNKLASYRTTPLVWIGSSTYSALIVYGFYKDFSIVFSSNRICDCNLEIEGLT